MVGMRMANIALTLLVMSLLLNNAWAYFNITFLNTTVVLNGSSSAKVSEIFQIYVSNSFASQYTLDRQAVNLTISQWQTALGSDELIQHIYNPRSSISNFNLLPGPLTATNQNGGTAFITLGYIAHNVTTVNNIAPRQFAYAFNDSVFNFVHTASGQALPGNVRFNIQIPKGAEIISIYPIPDYPATGIQTSYVNQTLFSWYAGDPLSTFSFTYLMHQSLQDEVLVYFHNFYKLYGTLLWLVVLIAVALLAFNVYIRVFT